VSTGAAEEWERKHKNGWVALITTDIDGTYHSIARDSAAQQIMAESRDHSADLSSAQAAADQLVPPHDCTCPPWADVTARILIQAKCANNHDIVATFGRRELQGALSAGTLSLFCPRCNVARQATMAEQATFRRRLDEGAS
jgi:hypothetical protein